MIFIINLNILYTGTPAESLRSHACPRGLFNTHNARFGEAQARIITQQRCFGSLDRDKSGAKRGRSAAKLACVVDTITGSSLRRVEATSFPGAEQPSWLVNYGCGCYKVGPRQASQFKDLPYALSPR